MRVTLNDYLIFCEKPVSESHYIDFHPKLYEDSMVYDYKTFAVKIRDKYMTGSRYQVIFEEEDGIYKLVLDDLDLDIRAVIELLSEVKGKYKNTLQSLKRFLKEHQHNLVVEEIKRIKTKEIQNGYN